MGTTTPTTDRRAGLNTLLAVLLTALLVACGGILSRPRQGWNPSLGPVVPHDLLDRMRGLIGYAGDWTDLMGYLPDGWSHDPVRRRSATAATFAASLELAKQGQIELRQSDTFAAITIRRKPS